MMTGDLPNLTAPPSAVQSREPKLQPLAEISDILDSKRVPVNSKERENRTGKIPYYGATGQVGWIDDHLFDEELVLLGEDGAPFLEPSKPKAYIIRGKSWVNNHAHVLRARKVPAGWLAHYLNTISYDGLVTGTTRLKLTQGAMRQIQIPVLSYSTMQSIVAEIEKQFSRLDEAVANLKRVKANLKRYKAAVLKAAVEGRLVPTEAELARKEGRAYETGEQLLARILQERRAAWEKQDAGSLKKKYIGPQLPDTSSLPQLPEGWIWVSLDALISSGPQNGLYLPKDSYGSGHPILRIDDYQVDWIKPVNQLQRVRVNDTTIAAYSLCEGDLVINRVNSPSHLGKAAVIASNQIMPLFESNMMRLTLVGIVLPAYIGVYLQSTDGRKRLLQGAKWAVNQASINQQDVRSVPVALPPLIEQYRIVSEVDRCLSLSCELQKAIQTSEQRGNLIRQSTLAAVFNAQ
jgi:type I restriction enzyme S subunit